MNGKSIYRVGDIVDVSLRGATVREVKCDHLDRIVYSLDVGEGVDVIFVPENSITLSETPIEGVNTEVKNEKAITFLRKWYENWNGNDVSPIKA